MIRTSTPLIAEPTVPKIGLFTGRTATTGAVSVNPYPSIKFTPIAQKKLSIAGGKAPPPETPTLNAFPSFARILLNTRPTEFA